MKKDKLLCFAVSLCVIFCGLWYLSYSGKNKTIFSKGKTTYYYNVKTQQDFINELKAEKVVNINTADKERLTSLNGIGPKIAERIIEYRQEFGNFSKKEDIMNVKGIGESTFNDIKDFISVEGES